MMDCRAKNPACFAPDVCFPETCHFLAKHEADRAPYIQALDARFMGGWGGIEFDINLLVQDFVEALLRAVVLACGGLCAVKCVSLFLGW